MIVLSWMTLIILTLAYLVRPLVNMKMFKSISKDKGFLRVITLSMLACGVTVLIVFSAYEGRLVFNSSEIQRPLEYQTVENLADLNSELSESANQRRPLLLEFFADWCVECKRMESGTFLDAGSKRVAIKLQCC